MNGAADCIEQNSGSKWIAASGVESALAMSIESLKNNMEYYIV